jgi:hypothetical protein
LKVSDRHLPVAEIAVELPDHLCPRATILALRTDLFQEGKGIAERQP